MCLLGGALCVLSGILCLVSVSWSAVATISIYNDPLIAAELKRDVGSSVYIGWASSVLLLLGGILILFVCGQKTNLEPAHYSFMPYGSNTRLSDSSPGAATLRSDVPRSYSSNMLDNSTSSRIVKHVAQVHDLEFGPYYHPQVTEPSWS